MKTHPVPPLKIATVPYLNALPLYVGLADLLPEASFEYLPPSEVAKYLRLGKADLGLIPTFSLLEGGMSHLVALPDVGICSYGEVLSVYIGSKVPLQEIKEVYLDPQSRSSVALLRILAPKNLSAKIRYLSTIPGYEKQILGRRAGLVIGDRALKLREEFPFRLDLGKAWRDYTALPFVYALWAIRREKMNEKMVETLRLACQLGKNKLKYIAEQWAQTNQFSKVMAERYLKEHIRYELGPLEHEGLKRFIHLAIALEMAEPQREINFYASSSFDRSGISGKED